MSNPSSRKALIAITSYNGVIYPDGTKTGLFYTEALHPYEVLTKAGFEVDLATETGTYGLDELSTTKQFLAGGDKAVFDDPNHPFNIKLSSQLKKASEVRKQDYDVFFASAGHAALYDYPKARGLQSIAEDVWNRGGIVAAVCHGPVILSGVIDPKTAKPIIDGKSVTGFTVEGEVIMEVFDKLKSDGARFVVDVVEKAGAYYSSPMLPFDDYSITVGRLVTGANPASARSTAERVLKAFEKLSIQKAA
jgi:putative intracellular protease/amidase